MAAEICTLAAIRHTTVITAFMSDILVQNMEQLLSYITCKVSAGTYEFQMQEKYTILYYNCWAL